MLIPKLLRGKKFVWTLTQSIQLRIFIITPFWNWNDHSPSSPIDIITIWAPYEKISTLQFTRPSQNPQKIANFKSAISPPSEVWFKWFFLQLGYFFEQKSDLQFVTTNSSQKSSKLTEKVTIQYFSSNFLHTPKNISHFALERALIQLVMRLDLKIDKLTIYLKIIWISFTHYITQDIREDPWGRVTP